MYKPNIVSIPILWSVNYSDRQIADHGRPLFFFYTTWENFNDSWTPPPPPAKIMYEKFPCLLLCTSKHLRCSLQICSPPEKNFVDRPVCQQQFFRRATVLQLLRCHPYFILYLNSKILMFTCTHILLMIFCNVQEILWAVITCRNCIHDRNI